MKNIQHMKNIQFNETIKPFKNIQSQKTILGVWDIVTGDIFRSDTFRGDIYFSGAKMFYISVMSNEN